MKYLPIAVFVASIFVFSSCQKENAANQNSAQEITGTQIPEYQVSDITIRSLNSNYYVKELSLLNADGKTPSFININGSDYSDNGRNNDLQADDGVFTSLETFEHNAEVPYFE